MAYFWPLILVVASNSVYHICAKSLPESVDPLASLTVTYLIGSIFSGILYFVTNRGGANLLHEYSQMNWAPYLLGLAVVGLEAGSMHAYKAGWPVSAFQVSSAPGCTTPTSPASRTRASAKTVRSSTWCRKRANISARAF